VVRVMMILIVGALAGCGGGGPKAPSAGLRHADDGPAVPVRPIDPAAPDQWEQAALNLQALIDRMPHASAEPNPADGAERPTMDAAPPTDGRPEATPSEPAGDAGPETTGDASPADDGESVRPAEPADEDPQQVADSRAPTVDHLGDRLRAALRERAAASDDPIGDVVRLAVLAGLLDRDWAWDERLSALVPLPAQRVHVESAHAIVREWTGEPRTGAVLELIERTRAALDEADPQLRVSDVQLCSSVYGLGKYDAFASSSFLAGQPIRLIVYTELDRFSQREEGGEWIVDLSQEVTLYHDAPSDLQVWHRPRARLRDRALRERRDFYLVNELVLPARLTVGAYRMKVITRDEQTGAVAERIVPIRIVADASLAVRPDD